MELVLAGNQIQLNDQGYLTDFSQWTKEVGEAIAQQEGIALTDAHWKVIHYLQDQHKQDIPLSIRKIGKSNVVSIKEFYDLFPTGPLKISSKIARIPKPASCI